MAQADTALAERSEATTRPDLRSLPFGLKRYRPGVFEKLHACGSKTITASLVSALFGESRFVGRFAVMCHVAGINPLPDFGDSTLMERGQRLEAVAVDMVGEDKGWLVYHAKSWATHPQIPAFVASPDAIAWRQDSVPAIGEVKVVADLEYQRRWMDGPPLDVELQHQAQFACTGATWGFIAALVVGTFRWDLLIFETAPDRRVIDIIEREVADVLAKIEAGDMGAPDEHATSIAAAQQLWQPEPGKVLALNDPEADDRLERWLQARADRLAAEKVEDAQKRYFAARALDHGLIQCPGGGTVKVSSRKRKATVIEACEFRVLEPKEAKED